MGNEHTVDQYLKLMNISSVLLDRSGEKIALEVSKPYHEKKSPTETAVVVFSAKERKPLLELREKNVRKHFPVFNSVGNKIAYLEKADEKHSLVIHNLTENISEKIELDGDPVQLQWHGDSILILMNDPVRPELKKKHDEGLDGTFFEEEEPYCSLYQYIPGSGFRKLTENLQVWEFDSVGNTAVLVASSHPYEWSWFRSKLYSLALEEKKLSQIYDPGFRSLARPKISPDGLSVLFAESLRSDHGLTMGDIIKYSLKDGSHVNLTEGHKRSYSDISWLDNSTIAALWLQQGTFGISE